MTINYQLIFLSNEAVHSVSLRIQSIHHIHKGHSLPPTPRPHCLREQHCSDAAWLLLSCRASREQESNLLFPHDVWVSAKIESEHFFDNQFDIITLFSTVSLFVTGMRKYKYLFLTHVVFPLQNKSTLTMFLWTTPFICSQKKKLFIVKYVQDHVVKRPTFNCGNTVVELAGSAAAVPLQQHCQYSVYSVGAKERQ